MRIIYVGDLNEYSRALARLRAFRDLGIDVYVINTSKPGDMELGYVRPSLLQRVLNRFGVVADTTGAGTAIRDNIDDSVDLLWVDKGSTISPSVLYEVRLRFPRIKLILFSEDDLFMEHNRTNRLTAGLGIYDIVFTTKSNNVANRELESLGAKRVEFVFQAFDPHQHYPIQLTEADESEFSADVSFIGSFERERAQSLLSLARAGITVRVWGNGWAASSTHEHLKIEGRPLVNSSSSLSFSKGITASKINLCFLRKINRDQHTSRSFEIPAIGGFMLAERTDEHNVLFREGEEAAFFGDDAELLAKTTFYLSNAEQRMRVARAGHERCISDYTSIAQARHMLQVCGLAP